MRVVGGRLRGRNLASPSSHEIRPTADRLRESVFNILIHAYDNPIGGARVLDLFAGTGALGIEAISRGAKFALFVDNGAEARADRLLAVSEGDESASAAGSITNRILVRWLSSHFYNASVSGCLYRSTQVSYHAVVQE